MNSTWSPADDGAEARFISPNVRVVRIWPSFGLAAVAGGSGLAAVAGGSGLAAVAGGSGLAAARRSGPVTTPAASGCCHLALGVVVCDAQAPAGPEKGSRCGSSAIGRARSSPDEVAAGFVSSLSTTGGDIWRKSGPLAPAGASAPVSLPAAPAPLAANLPPRVCASWPIRSVRPRWPAITAARASGASSSPDRRSPPGRRKNSAKPPSASRSRRTITES